MELEFVNKPLDCLRQAVWEVKNEEQTQELKLSDNLPDVGRVLGAWGQVLMRGKEWRGASMSVSGGVLVWVLYEPEDGGELQTLETWVPFSVRWEFPQTKQDGTMCIQCLLKAVDARCVSARKLMIRTVVSAAGEALEPVKCDRYVPDGLPEDVQVLKRNYPVRIGVEAGEKAFFLDEELMLPSNMADVAKILNCSIQPKVRECKLVAGKGVFRGTAVVHLLYLGVDGVVYTKDFDVPYSQYSDLEKETSEAARISVKMAVTDLETEQLPEGKLRLKCGLVGQYVIYDCPVLELIEDAYSVKSEVISRQRPLELWQILDQNTFEEEKEEVLADIRGRCVDVSVFCGHPCIRRGENGMEAEAEGSFQLLYYDEEGKLRSVLKNWTGSRRMDSDEDVKMMAVCAAEPVDQGIMDAAGVRLRACLNWEMTAASQQGLTGVCCLEVTEKEDRQDKPSLILTTLGSRTLWELAKHCGSTVEAIQKANGFEDAPGKDSILLIPVL